MHRLAPHRLPSLLFLSFSCLLFCLGACRDGASKLPPPHDDMMIGEEADMPLEVSTRDMHTVEDQGEETGEMRRRPTTWRVLVAEDAPEAILWSAQDVMDYLEEMGQQVTLVKATDAAVVECGEDDSTGTIALMGDGLGEHAFQTRRPPEQTWAYHEEACERGALIRLAGIGLLGRQYAVYEWLHELGVRYFHPEQEFVPDRPHWPSRRLMQREHTPDFFWRSVTLHLAHPLELGDVFRLDRQEYALEGKRYIDWQIKNGASLGHTGFGRGEYATYGIERGLPRAASHPLHSQQQGDGAVVDPDDPRPSTMQIADFIDELMGDDPEKYLDLLHFTFNPSEFTELDDEVSVAELTFLANYMKEHYPDTLIQTTNHAVTSERLTDTYGVRYFDLSKFAPPNLGVRVHTVMFYDLFRPAPVYGNESFHYAYDFMLDQYTQRQIWHYPEAAWWLTFDNALPLYLPITLEARDRDIQGISFMLQGKLDGHRVFGSGHEWGYWQNEYCPFRMTSDIEYRHTDCIRDIAFVTGEVASPVVQAVLLDAISYQERDLIYGDVLPYVVGTDPETEIATAVGIFFHPLPPAPREIMRWDLEGVRHFEAAIAPALQRMDEDYAALLERLDAVRDDVPDKGRPWFDEIYDGLEVTMLRARHGREVYGAAVTMRKSQLLLDPSLSEQALDMLAQAKQTTQAAIEVVHRRERGYRYQPLSRSIGGGPEGTEDENWTVYGYRYLNRTHHGYYYTRIDDLVEEAWQGSGDVVIVQDAMITTSEELVVQIADTELSEILIDFGDGATTTTIESRHSYEQAGLYTLRMTAKRGDQDVEFEGVVAVVESEENLGFEGKIKQPAGTEIIEPVLPAMVIGPIDAARMAIGLSPSESGHVPLGLVTVAALDEVTSSEFQTLPRRFIVPVVNRATESVSTSLIVEAGTVGRRAPGEAVIMDGQLSTDAIISAVVAVGGFEPVGARRLVAGILGYTPSTLPSTVPFALHFAPEEVE